MRWSVKQQLLFNRVEQKNEDDSLAVQITLKTGQH